MAIRLLDTAALLDAHADAWNQLAAGHPMRGHDWLSGWWRHYRLGSELFTLAVFDENETLIGLAPWRLETSARRGAVIRWLGDGEVCTDHLSLLIADGQTEAVVDQIADFLVDACEDWDLLRLDDADADDPRLAALSESLAQRGCDASAADAGACWAIELPNEWEAFLARQSKSHRKQLRRAERRVLESDACEWRPVTTQAELDTAWPQFVDLHQRRRASLGEPGCFASPRFGAFHRELAGRLLDRDQLRLSLLLLSGVPAAAEYHLAGPDAVYAYQGGVDPERLDEEPGRLSNIATIKAAVEAGVARFDFLRGDEPYKAHWRAEPRPTVHHRVVPPRRAAQLRAGAERFLGSVRTSLSGLRSS